MNNWVVDIGNTKTAFGSIVNGALETRVDIPTKDLATAGINFLSHGDKVSIASVVPIASTLLCDRLRSLGVSYRLILSRDVPIANQYREIDNLGTDRILAAYAAHSLYAKPLNKHVIVVSLGTATTFECVSKEGIYLGGAITLGVGSIIDAVHERTAQLPKVPLELPRSLIGRTTMESLQSGIINTQLLGMAQFVWALAEEAFTDDMPLLIATGGLAQFAQQHTQIFDAVDADLVLKGMALIV